MLALCYSDHCSALVKFLIELRKTKHYSAMSDYDCILHQVVSISIYKSMSSVHLWDRYYSVKNLSHNIYIAFFTLSTMIFIVDETIDFDFFSFH